MACFTDSLIVHEFLHAFGFLHEHQRPDRDWYVEIVWPNILEWTYMAFMKFPHFFSFDVPYDGNSIMHYAHNAGSKNGQSTILSKVCVFFRVTSFSIN